MAYSATQPRPFEDVPQFSRRDSSVKDHDPSTHPETWFHIPGDGNWVDDLGNMTVDENTFQVDLFVEATVPGTVSGLFESGATNNTSTWRWSPIGQFSYSPPTNLFVGPFTMACLVRLPPGVPFLGDRQIMAIKPDGLTRGLQMGTGGVSPQARADFSVGGAGDEIEGGDIADGNWHHLCASCSGSETLDDWTVKLYVDGLLIGTLLNRLNPVGSKNSTRLFLGTGDIAGSADCRIAARSFIGIRKQLSDVEVAALSTATIGSP